MTRHLQRPIPRFGRHLLLVTLVPLLLAGCNQAPTITGGPTPPPSWPAPALVVVEDSPGAHPHSGLQRADIVFEFYAEGGVSRFNALYFNPSGSQKIEPVRSTRLITIRLQKAYHALIYTSGASNHVLSLLYGQHIPFVMEQSGGGRFFARDPNRGNPDEGITHNLYTTEDQLKDGIARRHMRIFYQPPTAGTPAGTGTPATHIAFNETPNHGVTYVYSKAAKAYEYEWSWNGVFKGPETDTDNGNKPLMVTTVVVAYARHVGMHYSEDVLGEEGNDVLLQGTGPADVFVNGLHYQATWDLSNPNSPMRILGANGKEMHFPAGLMWVNIVDPGTAITAT